MAEPTAFRPLLGLTEAQIKTIKDTFKEEIHTQAELDRFIYQCERTGLDPLSRQIYPTRRDGKLMIIASIDGFRLIADRTGKYAGQLGPQWCGPDGVWKDVWLEDKMPVAARVGILRKDFAEPLWSVARFKAYAQYKKDGSLNHFWYKMFDIMIAKCAESLGLRRGFPQELSGLYTLEELGKDEKDEDEMPKGMRAWANEELALRGEDPMPPKEAPKQRTKAADKPAEKPAPEKSQPEPAEASVASGPIPLASTPAPATASATNTAASATSGESERPGNKELGEIMSVGQNKGWNKQQINHWFAEWLVANGVVDKANLAKFAEHWTFETVSQIKRDLEAA